MSDAKIEISIGQIQFSGQGEQEWVSQQLEKVLIHADKLLRLNPVTNIGTGSPADGAHKPMGDDSGISKKTLPAFLGEKNASQTQARKFLATAVWLEAKGQGRLTTSDITNALKASNQSRLSNPGVFLGENIKKGFCEKDGDKFYVTEEGKKSL